MKYWVGLLLLLSPSLWSHPCDTGCDSLVPNRIILAMQPSWIERFENGEQPSPVPLIAELLDVQVEFYPCPWARCLKAIETGRADIISDLYLTDDRQTYVNYLPTPYHSSRQAFTFFAKRGSSVAIAKASELEGKVVATVRGNAHYPEFDQNPRIVKAQYPTWDKAVGALDQARVDLLIVPAAIPDARQEHMARIHDLELMAFRHYVTHDIYLGVSKSSPWHHRLSDLHSAQAQVEEVRRNGFISWRKRSDADADKAQTSP